MKTSDAERSVASWADQGLLRHVRNENGLSNAATRHLLPASVAENLKGRIGDLATEADAVNPREIVAGEPIEAVVLRRRW